MNGLLVILGSGARFNQRISVLNLKFPGLSCLKTKPGHDLLFISFVIHNYFPLILINRIVQTSFSFWKKNSHSIFQYIGLYFSELICVLKIASIKYKTPNFQSQLKSGYLYESVI